MQREEVGRLAPAEMRAILFFACAELLDVATTMFALRSGLLREGNPLAVGVMASGTEVLMVLKLTVMLGVLLAAHRLISPNRRAWALLLLGSIAMIAPVSNLAHLLLIAR
ncbi:MAG TPA: DUF5658 family protein [Candidatus Solibacter sp.]|jgi:hypothetical protein|nr:DUF5658 family protein [Candidatus Solibacter sp.]